MQNTMYPHLANIDRIWEVVHLDKWTPTKNKYLPLRYPRQALDNLIASHLGQFAINKEECFIPGKAQHAFRSPYNPGPKVRPIYYINYAKAILSVRFAFSYHDWYDCIPPGTKITRFCSSVGCYNPDHHVFGPKPRDFDLLDLEQIVEITPDLEAWCDLTQNTITALITEAREAGDPDDKIIADVTRIATEIWGTKPIPSHDSIESLVKSQVHPTRMTSTYVSTDELQDMLPKR